LILDFFWCPSLKSSKSSADDGPTLPNTIAHVWPEIITESANRYSKP
jgi:hypothetical protein